jgi:hypothetical protein
MKEEMFSYPSFHYLVNVRPLYGGSISISISSSINQSINPSQTPSPQAVTKMLFTLHLKALSVVARDSPKAL